MGLGIRRLKVKGDSQLVVNQVRDDYGCPQMHAYVDEVRKLEKYFHGLGMEHIPRAQNSEADELSKIAARKEPVPQGIFIERLTKPSTTPGQPKQKRRKVLTRCLFPGDLPSSIPKKHTVLTIESARPDWAHELLRYMEHDELPNDRKDAERIVRQSLMYSLIDGDLY